MKKLLLETLIAWIWSGSILSCQSAKAALWRKYEVSFLSDRKYDNPLYDVREFSLVFTSATGRTQILTWYRDVTE